MMIKEIEFSSMNIRPPVEMAAAFLDAFTKRYQVKAKPLEIDWNDAWNELVRIGLNTHGPDVSEIGSTWLGGLHSMDALRPFAPSEIALLGGAEAFHPASWQACSVDRNKLIVAIPFTLDMRLILYRRDWLQKAGVDEASAFIDSDHFIETLRRLKAAGHPAPLAMPTSRSVTRLIHDMSCWVWSAGGDLRSDDGRRMVLMEPKGRAGMQAYFAMNEFIAPEMRARAEHEVSDDFHTGKCAVAITSHLPYSAISMRKTNVNAEVAENVGLAMLMQTPFIGGTGLSVWRHSHQYAEAIKLIQYLTSAEAWEVINQQALPYAPARLDVLAQTPLASTPFYPVIQKTLRNGRSFQTGYRWSGVESRLVVVIQSIWDDLYANPTLNIADEIEKRFSAVCKRLEETILLS